MSNRYVITRLSFHGQEYLAYAVFDEKPRLLEITCERALQTGILGNLYIGRVKDVVPNLNAAFIEIGEGITCYYSMEDYKHPLFTRKIGKKPLCVGDELVVQVAKDAVKTKFPVVTTNLNFTGRYLVLTTEKSSVGVSAKLTKDKRQELKELFSSVLKEEREGNTSERFGIVVRTNAGTASSEELMREYQELKEEYETFRSTVIHKTPFSLLKQAKPFYLKELEGLTLSPDDEVVTDDEEVYVTLRDSGLLTEPQQLRLYTDTAYPLAKLYSIENGIEEALREKVWLKSGAYLIISPTEALTLIDVNSGKNTAGKDANANFLKINKEAAAEIARQLRLRNISGICIVDFINMKGKEAQDELMHTFRMELKRDRIPVQLVDITKLGLVELTRKKVKRSLAEQLNACE